MGSSERPGEAEHSQGRPAMQLSPASRRLAPQESPELPTKPDGQGRQSQHPPQELSTRTDRDAHTTEGASRSKGTPRGGPCGTDNSPLGVGSEAGEGSRGRSFEGRLRVTRPWEDMCPGLR